VGMREMLTAILVPERVSVSKKNKVAFYSLANKFRDNSLARDIYPMIKSFFGASGT